MNEGSILCALETLFYVREQTLITINSHFVAVQQLRSLKKPPDLPYLPYLPYSYTSASGSVASSS